MPEQLCAVALVGKLVERFEMHREAYLGGRYNETPLRREFIDPLWKALGWGKLLALAIVDHQLVEVAECVRTSTCDP